MSAVALGVARGASIGGGQALSRSPASQAASMRANATAWRGSASIQSAMAWRSLGLAPSCNLTTNAEARSSIACLSSAASVAVKTVFLALGHRLGHEHHSSSKMLLNCRNG